MTSLRAVYGPCVNTWGRELGKREDRGGGRLSPRPRPERGGDPVIISSATSVDYQPQEGRPDAQADADGGPLDNHIKHRTGERPC